MINVKDAPRERGFCWPFTGYLYFKVYLCVCPEVIREMIARVRPFPESPNFLDPVSGSLLLLRGKNNVL